MGPPFAGDASWDPAKHPRGKRGLFVRVGELISALAGKAGENTAEHVPFALVRRASEVSGMVGIDVRGFRHAISNQAIAHIRKGHPDVTDADLRALPDVVRLGKAAPGSTVGSNGQPRVVYRAKVGGVDYVYVAEVRRGKRRLDAITFFKVG